MLAGLPKYNAITTRPRAFSPELLSAARGARVAIVVYVYNPNYAMIHAVVGDLHERFPIRGDVLSDVGGVLHGFARTRAALLCCYRGPQGSRAMAQTVAARYGGRVGGSLERTPAIALDAVLDCPCLDRREW